ncbi:MAG: hypothetical protein ACRD93_01250 [Nitrososphaeraceae archaeon]
MKVTNETRHAGRSEHILEIVTCCDEHSLRASARIVHSRTSFTKTLKFFSGRTKSAYCYNET